MDEQFNLLKELGAGDFQHLNGDLTSHLKGTAKILKSWGANNLLQTAGLFHAAYGTAGFSQSMVCLDQRQAIAKTIGKDEETLVYLYCSCDREQVFPQFGAKPVVDFVDRFTNTTFPLTSQDTALFCELTVANELELVYSSDGFKRQHGAALLGLFRQMEYALSQPAISAYQVALSDIT